MDTKVPSTAITSINGMRVLSMWWVILGHTYSIQTMWTIPVSKFSLIVCKITAVNWLNHWTTVIIKTAKDMYMRFLFLTTFFSFSIGNGLLAYDIIHRFTFQTVDNATFSVDSFFFLRCVLYSSCFSLYMHLRIYTSHAILSSGIHVPWMSHKSLVFSWYAHKPLGECVYQKIQVEYSMVYRERGLHN